ncbi:MULTISPECIES: V-type ATP synthase subunit I domain-containing protein [Lactobacillales]|uniref:DNA double-strand break repair Rad50 ATPase n=1 Tax=Marinilactibacillus psychrotolerans 42ea TaxID=1255609 RepID=A0A1R4K7B7_9LACT|nr:hypothetical protein [Marinilactibacillus psychrotolerans]SJN40084.1 DNA double-strand break repair Rad50 ATPase [Marinilactibacillus psychrotolerans 42ea]
MAKAFARQTKLKNVVGRSQYISDNQRQEHIVLHSQENMIHSWNEYADYEKQNRKNKEENIQGREIIIALPNELDQDREKLKEVVDDYSFNLLGDNRDFEYAVHWNKEKTNLHAHIIYSERERQKKEPKRYKRDYYYNYEEGKMSSKKDPNAVITKHKGDIKYDKEGEIEYTDQFSKKDTQFKSIEYNEKIKEQLAEILNKHDFKSRVFDNRIELPQAKLYKGASKDYKDKVSQSNKARREYNKEIVNAVDEKLMPMTMAIIRKESIMKQVKEENSKTKSISSRGIEIIKESVEEVKAYVREKLERIKEVFKPKPTALELEIKSLEDKTDQKINNLTYSIAENKAEIRNELEKATDVRDQREQLPSYKEAEKQVRQHESMIDRYEDMNREIKYVKRELKDVEADYKKLKFYEILKEKPLSLKHDELKEKLESLENKVGSIDIDKHKSMKKEIQSKINRIKNKENELYKEEKQSYNKIDRLEQLNKDHEEEIKGLRSLLKERIFELKNPELVKNRKEEKTSMSERIASAKIKAKEINEERKEKPNFSIGELQKTQKEIDRNKKEKLDKAKRKSRGVSR